MPSTDLNNITATASVLVNGSPTEEFPLERGLRQGDPLSPFLFLLAAEGLNVLMETAVARNLFTGYTVGERDPVLVSHLQFADVTLLLGAKSWANVRALHAVLVLFETMSGLKIPFVYLGLPIGGDPRSLRFWEPVLTRLQNRLSGWKSRFLSFGGRLVLLKSVLTSLPVYALSFFKAPSGKFLGLARNRFVYIRSVEVWGSGRYGVERGRLREGGRRGSVWWREIERIREGGELGGSWFGELVSKKVGDESDTFFWTDPWVEGIPLCERFARLFDLAGNKLRTVAEMFFLWWGIDGVAWEWRAEAVVGMGGGDVEGGAYQLLTSQASVSMDAANKLIWHPHVPLKVFIFVWRLLRDSGWIPGVTLLFVAYLACLRVGYVDGKKSQVISRLNKQFPSDVRQDQASLLQMVEDDKCYFSFKLS
ncbi:hypothetical protein TSUD_53550 [Trifolium subterraneum]|uniref:Reverse transcriptase domain-containing protein n=1 Tax=Trifolium subterraneum TaxID=3900 RepID=A0A2Z6MJE6_TRISU|nr:hypothetical protein TSUD_53550 [Trifolium subterraneum]